MTKHFTQNILRFLLLIVFAFSSGCGQSTATDSPTLTPTPSQTLTNTATPSPTNTPEPIHPEGKLIYYKGNAVYSLDLQTNNTKTVFTTNESQYDPILRDSFYYFLEDAGNSNYQVFRASLTQPIIEQLIFDNNYIYFYDVSPNEKYLSYTEQLNPAIAIFDIENKTSQIISQTKGYKYSKPAWSPDSKKLVYFESPDRSPEQPFGRLFLYSLEDKSTTELLSGKIIYLTTPEWSPNGKNIVLNMIDSQTGKQGIYLVNLENYSIDLIEGNTTGNEFEWSPRGNMILYLSDQLKLFDSYNNIQVVAKSTQDHSVMDSMWSPDGKYIGYVTCSWRTIDSGIYQGFPALDSCFFTIQDIATNEHLEIGIPATYNVIWAYP